MATGQAHLDQRAAAEQRQRQGKSAAQARGERRIIMTFWPVAQSLSVSAPVGQGGQRGGQRRAKG